MSWKMNWKAWPHVSDDCCSFLMYVTTLSLMMAEVDLKALENLPNFSNMNASETCGRFQSFKLFFQSFIYSFILHCHYSLIHNIQTSAEQVNRCDWLVIRNRKHHRHHISEIIAETYSKSSLLITMTHHGDRHYVLLCSLNQLKLCQMPLTCPPV